MGVACLGVLCNMDFKHQDRHGVPVGGGLSNGICRMKSSRWPLLGFMTFGLLSLTDFFFTWELLHLSPQLYEGNPIAGEWLLKYGWTGLAFFKTISAGVFLSITFIIIRYRPRMGALVLTFGCLAMVYVAVYSYRLLTNFPALSQSG
jgi:hypothetical protein